MPKTKTKQNLKGKEIIWLTFTIALILIFNFGLLGIDSLKLDSTIDINIHDTYFVIAKIHFFVFFAILILFGIYLVRILRCNFKNKTANLIFLIANILLILLFSKLISITVSFSQINGENEISEIGKGLMAFSNVLLIVQALLLILMIYSGIKTGINYKKNE